MTPTRSIGAARLLAGAAPNKPGWGRDNDRGRCPEPVYEEWVEGVVPALLPFPWDRAEAALLRRHGVERAGIGRCPVHRRHDQPVAAGGGLGQLRRGHRWLPP